MIRSILKSSTKATTSLSRQFACIGIDLGTTNSCVAVVEAGNPKVIENAEGDRTTPSFVAYTDSGEELVGIAAKRQATTNSSNTFYATKRLIGRKFNDPETKKDAKSLAYDIVSHSNGDAWVQTADGKKYSPSQVGASILRKMRETAQDYLGKEVNDAVVTVPAYFNDSQRQATKDAGQISGLNVKRIINEPTAAALSYGLNKQDSQVLAVYDLGGGTFDVSILEMMEGVFEVKSTNGDTSCGGEDIDTIILRWAIEEFKKANGNMDLSNQKDAVQRIKEAAEKAKIELSNSKSTKINLPFITMDQSGPKHMDLDLSRAQLESMTEAFINKTVQPCENCLKDGDISKSEIDEVILVGGMTRMPAVQEKVKNIFNKEPSKGVNPDEAVALGAAIQGGILEDNIKDIVLVDVTPLSLGIETMGGVFNRIIERNKTIPCSNTQTYTTAADNQSSVTIKVFQGEREMAADNKLLGNFDLTGIPPAPRGVPQINVSFEIDNNGIIKITANDQGTGKAQSITVKSSGGLSKAEIEKMVKDAEANADADKAKRERIDVHNELTAAVYKTQQSLDEHKDKLEQAVQDEIKKSIDEANIALGNDDADIDALNNAKTEMENAAMKIGQAIYNTGSTENAEQPAEEQTTTEEEGAKTEEEKKE